MDGQRAPQRTSGAARASVIAVVAAVALFVAAIALYQSGAGPAATASPPPALPTLAPRPSVPNVPPPTDLPGPTIDPGSVGACRLDQLALVAGGWSGATGSMAGGTTLINASSEACRISGTPSLQLEDKAGKVIAKASRPASEGASVVLVPGDAAGVIAVWDNWCADPPSRPLALRLTLAKVEGSLRARVLDWNGGVGGSELSSLPRCDAEDAPSTIGVPEPFAAMGPPEPGTDDAPCAAEDLVAFLGGWGAAAGTSYASIVVFNMAGVGCILDGSPPLELRNGNGALLARGAPWSEKESVDLAAGWAARTEVGFADWCAPPPRLPLAFNLRIGGARLAVAPTSRHAVIDTPACQSDPPSAEPDLFYTGPFALPDR